MLYDENTFTGSALHIAFQDNSWNYYIDYFSFWYLLVLICLTPLLFYSLVKYIQLCFNIGFYIFTKKKLWKN